MFKQVPKSEKIQGLIAKAYGDPNINLDNLAIFEAVAANTMPLVRRKTGIYAGARIGVDALAKMNATVNAGEHVPLQVMHRNGLPVGKVFATELRVASNGQTELGALFYLPKTDSALIAKLDSGVISEVSVGFTPEQLLCSACGWDYMGADSTFENIWDCTCANGHTIGKDGVHAGVHGLGTFQELSLVDRGAATGARVLPRPQQMMGDPTRMAARGFDDRAVYFSAALSETNPIEEDPPVMDHVALLATEKANVIVATAKVTELTASLTAAEAEKVTLTAKVAELEGQLAEAKKIDGPKAVADLAEVVPFIDEVTKACMAATGKADATLPETISGRITLIKEARANLALAIPAGGAAVAAAKAAADKTVPAANLAAFTRRSA